MQHAMVHSASMAQQGLPSFEDEVLDGMSAAQMRRIPQNEEHSVAWLLWHMARIEDVTMNMLVAGEAQLFNRENWGERLGAHSGRSGIGRGRQAYCARGCNAAGGITRL